MSIVNLWQGAVTDKSVRIKAKITGGSATLSINGGTVGPVTAVKDIVDFNIAGLRPNTDYSYSVSDGEMPLEGSITTFPTAGAPASFVFAAGSCAGQSSPNQVSNHEVFTHIKNHKPVQFTHMGDLHYRDINTNDPAPFHKAYDDVLKQPTQAELYRNIPIAYIYDDHDYGANDSVGWSPSRPSAIQTYRERVPHYPLDDSEAVYQTWVIGRVRFIMTDNRTNSDQPYNPDYTVTQYPEKTALGAKQWQWFQSTLMASTEELICWINPMPWHGGTDQITNWAAFSHERDRIATFLKANGFANRMFMVSGDWHGMGLDSGVSNKWGDFPVYHCAPLDSNPSTSPKPFPFSHGSSVAKGQWGKFTIEDTGEIISVLAEGYVNDTPVLSHSFVVGQKEVIPGEPAGELTRIIAAHYGDTKATRWNALYDDGTPAKVLGAHVGKIKDDHK